MQETSPEVVMRPRWNTVRGVMRQLTALAEARTAVEAERRLEQLLARAEGSIEVRNAAYVAAQVLRDSGVLSRAEAAYVFSELFAFHVEVHPENGCSDVIEAWFHRARGETALAELLVRDERAYRYLVAEGEFSLVEDKFAPDEDVAEEADPATVAAICERVTALAAAETVRETLATHRGLHDALKGADVASGMAAVQALRGIGLVSFRESIGLVSQVLSGLVNMEIEGDRECARVQRRIEALRGTEGAQAGGEPVAESTKAELAVLESRYDARSNAVFAACLRRFGEHDAATLLIEQPKEFDRWAEEAVLGAWGGPAG